MQGETYTVTRKTYRCGGYSAWEGHCGAEDCETCHPGCGIVRLCVHCDKEMEDCECEFCETCGAHLEDEECENEEDCQS